MALMGTVRNRYCVLNVPATSALSTSARTSAPNKEIRKDRAARRSFFRVVPPNVHVSAETNVEDAFVTLAPCVVVAGPAHARCRR